MLAGRGRCGAFAVKRFSYCFAFFVFAWIAGCAADSRKYEHGTFPLLSAAMLPDQHANISPRRVNGQHCWTGDNPYHNMLEEAFADALSKTPKADGLILLKFVLTRSTCIYVEGTPIKLK